MINLPPPRKKGSIIIPLAPGGKLKKTLMSLWEMRFMLLSLK